jgi:hypothetical protein
MRETGVVRARFFGNKEAAQSLMGLARKQLGLFKSGLKGELVDSLTHTTRLEDGSIIKVGVVGGQDFVEITVPAGSQSVPEEIEEPEPVNQPVGNLQGPFDWWVASFSTEYDAKVQWDWNRLYDESYSTEYFPTQMTDLVAEAKGLLSSRQKAKPLVKNTDPTARPLWLAKVMPREAWLGRRGYPGTYEDWVPWGIPQGPIGFVPTYGGSAPVILKVSSGPDADKMLITSAVVGSYERLSFNFETWADYGIIDPFSPGTRKHVPVVAFKNRPDYGNPADADHNSKYEFVLEVVGADRTIDVWRKFSITARYFYNIELTTLDLPAVIQFNLTYFEPNQFYKAYKSSAEAISNAPSLLRLAESVEITKMIVLPQESRAFYLVPNLSAASRVWSVPYAIWLALINKNLRSEAYALVWASPFRNGYFDGVSSEDFLASGGSKGLIYYANFMLPIYNGSGWSSEVYPNSDNYPQPPVLWGSGGYISYDISDSPPVVDSAVPEYVHYKEGIGNIVFVQMPPMHLKAYPLADAANGWPYSYEYRPPVAPAPSGVWVERWTLITDRNIQGTVDWELPNHIYYAPHS